MLPHRCRPIGGVLLALGCTVILALVLPSGCWWFLLGLGLIGAGVALLARR